MNVTGICILHNIIRSVQNMKMKSMERYAKRLAEMILRPGFVFLMLMIVTAVFASSADSYVKETKSERQKAIYAIQELIKQDMAKCARTGVKMQYAGANVKEKLLPDLKTHLYSLSCLVKAQEDAFGIMHTPVSGHFINKTINALTMYEKDLGEGKPSEKSRQALIECLNAIDEILKGV